MNQRHLTVPVLLASALLLTACGGEDDDAASAGSGGHGGGHSSSAPAADSAKGNDADVAFLAGMKPHHEQAVEMSDIVLAADPTAEVAAIAEQIKDAQAPEIKQIETMLADLGADASTGHGGGHAEHGGMTSEADMAALKAAEGEQAARLYLEAMIKHHEGAIDAADAQVEDGEYEPARQLATSIAKEQAAEIDRMKALLAAL